ncbi:type III-B CRISPR module-associated protein Cmr5 [Desulfobacter hydrogenophilus]|uniref:CRISPR type III-B/RAMP module-associated protein Cmr5 n=1 Tax=Desulfobacter hydrogenophilus TaxID=2291 RepID=A0A328FDL8_9BACT|nr:type III-B CRISPR module-associated protein Cmr5 [Desulfobacter hydrogenophilus]NDY71656.1 type III-B CRISPR module-associated protein Cmr5 [Desulfobacter hydrogenophilus]QBH13170.1 type III-B CRISPR module-associated protein Cmr5 [Desulfobacter hydrogenophilus]RAM02409.1 type III-B CRISPR module-associated protein Cmr5 [Desulfobacter hydrogenophilus]
MQTNDQRYSNEVFQTVQAMVEDQQAGKYKTICKKAGSLVRNLGLMQALAFMKARGQRDSEVHHHTLLDHLRTELINLGCIPAGTTDLPDHIRTVSLSSYMIHTRQVLLLLNWHKRLADTLISQEE